MRGIWRATFVQGRITANERSLPDNHDSHPGNENAIVLIADRCLNLTGREDPDISNIVCLQIVVILDPLGIPRMKSMFRQARILSISWRICHPLYLTTVVMATVLRIPMMKCMFILAAPLRNIPCRERILILNISWNTCHPLYLTTVVMATILHKW